MNVTTNNRLIGIAVALIVLFLLTWLIPSKKKRPMRSQSIPVAAIPVGSGASSDSSTKVASTRSVAPSNGEGTMAKTNPTGLTSPLTEKDKGRSPSENPKLEGARGVATTAPQQQSTRKSLRAPTKQMNAQRRKSPPVSASSMGTAAKFYVQIASFRHRGDAKKMTSLLHRKSIKAHINRVMVDGHPYFRLQLGPYPTRKDAEAERVHMIREGYKHAWISH